MKTILLFAFITFTSQMFGDSLEVVAFSRSAQGVKGHSIKGPIALETAHIDVRLKTPSGKTQLGIVTVIFSRANGHYFRHYDERREGGGMDGILSLFLTGEFAVYVDSDRLIELYMPWKLSVIESTSRADSLDHAEHEVLNKLRRALAENAESLEEMPRVVIVPPLGFDFPRAPNTSFCPERVKFEKITRTDSQGRLQIKCLGTAEVVLDRNYVAVSAVRTDK